jgi:O-antigen/teichoic acid export membrane protein
MSIARHTAYNVVGSTVPIAVSLVTVPLYIKAIGVDRYGLLAICWLLVGYFNLFDFGLGRATSQKVATLANASAADRSRIFWTSVLLSSALCVVAVIVFAPAAAIGLGLMKLSPSAGGLRGEVVNALPFLVAALPFGIMQSVLLGSLEGRREFLKINLINSTGTIATAVLPLLAALWIDPRLPVLLGAALIARTLVITMLIPACIAAVPVQRPQIAHSGEIKRLLSFGGWTTITNAVGPIMVVWDRFAIGAILGSAAVAVYVVPFNLAWQILILPAAMMSALFPKLAAEELSVSRSIRSQAISALAFIMTPAALLMILVAPPFLNVWLGPSLGAKTAPIACILLFGIWTNSFARIAFIHIQARGRPKLPAHLMLAEILPYIAALYLLMRWLGLPGAALAWSLRCVADTVALFVLDKLSWKQLAPLGGQSLLVLVAVGLSLILPAWSVARLLLMIGALGIGAWIVWPSKPPQVDQVVDRLFSVVLRPKPAGRSSHDG